MEIDVSKELAAIRRKIGARCAVLVFESREGEVKVLNHRASAVQLIGLAEYIKATGAIILAEKAQELAQKRNELRKV